MTGNKIEKKTESLKKFQHDKIENVAGSVWLSLFMDGNGKCKLPSKPTSTGLSRVQHVTRTWWSSLNLETSDGGYHGTFNVTQECHSMKSGVWSPSKSVPLMRKQWAELNKMKFWNGICGYESAYHI
jgi:hypothetical protein